MNGMEHSCSPAGHMQVTTVMEEQQERLDRYEDKINELFNRQTLIRTDVSAIITQVNELYKQWQAVQIRFDKQEGKIEEIAKAAMLSNKIGPKMFWTVGAGFLTLILAVISLIVTVIFNMPKVSSVQLKPKTERVVINEQRESIPRPAKIRPALEHYQGRGAPELPSETPKPALPDCTVAVDRSKYGLHIASVEKD